MVTKNLKEARNMAVPRRVHCNESSSRYNHKSWTTVQWRWWHQTTATVHLSHNSSRVHLNHWDSCSHQQKPVAQQHFYYIHEVCGNNAHEISAKHNFMPTSWQPTTTCLEKEDKLELSPSITIGVEGKDSGGGGGGHSPQFRSVKTSGQAGVIEMMFCSNAHD